MKEWAKSLGLAFILFLIIRIFLVQAFKIPTGSMEKTLLVGDYLLVNKMVYGAKTPRKLPLLDLELPIIQFPGFDTPQRGDIVVFEYPKDRDMDFVKRCVAVSGDTVEMRDKVLYINSIPQSENYIQQIDPTIRRDENRFYGSNKFAWQVEYLVDELRQHPQEYRPTRDNFGPLVIPQGKYFCLGDNRDYSSDSRFWGFVDQVLIKGRPMLLYFSWNKEHKFPRFDRIGQIIQ
ncbi:signal peptidase I [Gemmatimonadota bacterium]